MQILVLNSGSSSIKFSLYALPREQLIASGKVERIGAQNSQMHYMLQLASGEFETHSDNVPISEHGAGIKAISKLLNQHQLITSKANFAIGHRVVHGGETFWSPVLIDDQVMQGLRNCIPLAPLHNPLNITGIETMQELYPHVPQVAVFDTGFFRYLPAHAHRYALPNSLYPEVRRFGFHGISHQYVLDETARYLNQSPQSLRIISLHLGNGASAAAVKNGLCIDTSMGMTPMEGLIMGTRCGDLDPAIPNYLTQKLGLSMERIDRMLNQESGIKGLCGVSDMREVHYLAQSGDRQAELAIEMYCYRIRKYIGAYYTALEGLDALVFTGGIGEHDRTIRRLVCTRLSVMGILFDEQRNRENGGIELISAKDSAVRILVVPTNEELAIARQTLSLLNT